MRGISTVAKPDTFDRILNISLVVLLIVFITLLVTKDTTKLPVRANEAQIISLKPMQSTAHPLYAQESVIADEPVATASTQSSQSGANTSKKLPLLKQPELRQILRVPN